MTSKRKAVSIISPIGATVAALAEFGTCIFTVSQRGGPSLGHLTGIVLSEIGLVACAIWLWVMYFRKYVELKIEERWQRPKDESGDISG